MSDLVAFLGLGFHHITDLAALDHLLFLLALAALYRGRDWRDAVWVVSAFTAGHSITLAMAVSGAVALPTRLIEFLIPLTIVATGLDNIVARRRVATPWARRRRPALALLFGLVHGAGFANYLRSLFDGSIAWPLLGFNLGIEAGQMVVLAAAGLALAALDRTLLMVSPAGRPVQRLRTVAVSAVVVAVSAGMAAERLPW